MLIFLDTRFTDDIHRELISIALVTDEGNELYAERIDFNACVCIDFVVQNMLPLLGRVPGAACTSIELKARLQKWFSDLAEPAVVVFEHGISWHLLLTALGDCPKNVSGTLELTDEAGEELAKEAASTYTNEWPQYHSLADARALMHGFNVLSELEMS